MIKNVSSTGRYMNVVSTSTGSNYINHFSGAQGVGNTRFNTIIQQLEVFDGTNWIPLSMGHATVGLNHHAESLLDWVEKKRQEEIEMAALAETNPTIKDLMETIKQKQEQISIVKTLIKKETTVETR